MTDTTTEIPRPRRDIYREVTDRIIKAMEENKAPWQRPWTELAEFGMPQNGQSGRHYHGVNSVLLFLTAQEHGYGDSRWMTFRQANEAGYKIRKGEKSAPVYFYKPLAIEEKDKETGEMVKREIPYLCEYRVFNSQQIEGMPGQVQREPNWNPIEQVEALIKQHNPEIRIGGNRAFYSPDGDYIQMPSKGQFLDAGAWTSTLLHEFSHHSGAPHRLNRQFGRFGDETYAKEELRAEWASAMLSAELGIPTGTENHAAYLSSWVKALKNDKYEVFRAARDAERICDFIMFRQPEEQLSPKVAPIEASTQSAELEKKSRFQRVGEQLLAERGIHLPWQKARTEPTNSEPGSGMNTGSRPG